MDVLLDTSFIISCIRDNIDFASQLEEKGFTIAVPKEVVEELKDLKKEGRESHGDRVAINLALDLIASKKFKKVTLSNRKVDDGLIQKGKDGIYIATLDNAIKRQIPNKVVIFRAQKAVGIERD